MQRTPRSKAFGTKNSLLKGASIFAMLSLVPTNAALASESGNRIEDVGNFVVEESSPTNPSNQSNEISENNEYFLRLITQVYDGREDLSQTQILGLARVRRGNRSYSQFDFGDGAVVITGQEDLSLGRFSNKTSVEQAVEYDYSIKTVIGDTRYAQFHNTYVRPWLGKSPDLDSNASWSTKLPMSAFGMANLVGGDVKIELSREYFEYDGKPMVLVLYSIPAFAYDLDGKKVVQWGRGFSLTDPGFGQIYFNAALHRSAVRENGSIGNPYRYARTMVAANPDGSAMIDYRNVAQLDPYIDEFFSKEALQVIPTKKSVSIVDGRPLVLAQNMDLMALSIGEDGANEVPITAGAQTSGDRGVEVFDADATPVTDVDPLLIGTAAFRTQAREVLLSKGMSDRDADRLLNTLIKPDRNRDLIDRYDQLDEFRNDIYRMLPSYEDGQRPESELTPSELALKQVISTYVKVNDYIRMEARLEGARRNARERWLASGKPIDDPEFQATEKEAIAAQEKILNTRYERLFENLQLTNDQIDLANKSVSAWMMSKELVPGSMRDPSNGESSAAENEELFALLQEEILRGNEESNGYDTPSPLPPIQLTDAQVAETQIEQRRVAAQEELDQQAKDRLDAENERRREAGEIEIQNLDEFETAAERKAAADAALAEMAQEREEQRLALEKAKEDDPRRNSNSDYLFNVSDIKISELKVTELKTSELQISGFDDFIEEEERFKNPDFVPPAFTPPKASQFPPTDPNDVDGYPGTGQYPAFDFENLDFTFNTDLSPYEDWLATQNLAHLDRLAKNAGFPNFAAAVGAAEYLIRLTRDPKFRQYAYANPACSPSLGCVGTFGEFTRKRSLLALGDLLNESRAVFSTGGFSDIGISGFNLQFSLTDFGIQDGDLVDVEIFQFGRRVFLLENHLLLTAGSDFNANLQQGVSQLIITALNEGTASPNTAAVDIQNVVNGDGEQNFSLETFQTATLRVETNASPRGGE